MSRRHNSYLVRCWTLRNGVQRIEIVHIQSGEKVLLTSFDAAVEWLSSFCAGIPDSDSTGTEQGEPAHRE